VHNGWQREAGFIQLLGKDLIGHADETERVVCKGRSGSFSLADIVVNLADLVGIDL
jgi:hypothetical protein